MDEDDLTPPLPYMLLHRAVEVVTLIVMDICARHTRRRLEDLRSMEVDDEGLITARSRGRSLWSRLLILLLRLKGRGQSRCVHLGLRLLSATLYDGEHQRVVGEVVVGAEGMELEELRHVELEAYREGVLQLRDTPVVEGKYLDGELLKVIEISRGELL